MKVPLKVMAWGQCRPLEQGHHLYEEAVRVDMVHAGVIRNWEALPLQPPLPGPAASLSTKSPALDSRGWPVRSHCAKIWHRPPSTRQKHEDISAQQDASCIHGMVYLSLTPTPR